MSRPRAQTFLFGASVALSTAGFGCGPFPDLKVLVTGIPVSANKLAVIVWKQTAKIDPALDGMKVYDLPAQSGGKDETRDYTLGLVFEHGEHGTAYKINVAAFDVTDKSCLRISTSGEQAAKFDQETNITVAMPLLKDNDLARFSPNPTQRCYPGVIPLAMAPPPLIGSVSVTSQRLIDGNVATDTQFLIRGWNFSPYPSVFAQLGGQSKMVHQMGLSASEIQFSLDQVTLKEAAATNMPLTIAVINEDLQVVTTAVTFNP